MTGRETFSTHWMCTRSSRHPHRTREGHIERLTLYRGSANKNKKIKKRNWCCVSNGRSVLFLLVSMLVILRHAVFFFLSACFWIEVPVALTSSDKSFVSGGSVTPPPPAFSFFLTFFFYEIRNFKAFQASQFYLCVFLFLHLDRCSVFRF